MNIRYFVKIVIKSFGGNLNMKEDMILTYMPPIKFDKYDLTTWPKVFIIKKEECPEELDFRLKINELIQTYHMLEDFVSIVEYDSNLFS